MTYNINDKINFGTEFLFYDIFEEIKYVVKKTMNSVSDVKRLQAYFFTIKDFTEVFQMVMTSNEIWW